MMQNGNPDHLKSNVNNTTKTIFNSKNIDVDSNDDIVICEEITTARRGNVQGGDVSKNISSLENQDYTIEYVNAGEDDYAFAQSVHSAKGQSTAANFLNMLGFKSNVVDSNTQQTPIIPSKDSAASTMNYSISYDSNRAKNMTLPDMGTTSSYTRSPSYVEHNSTTSYSNITNMTNNNSNSSYNNGYNANTAQPSATSPASLSASSTFTIFDSSFRKALSFLSSSLQTTPLGGALPDPNSSQSSATHAPLHGDVDPSPLFCDSLGDLPVGDPSPPPHEDTPAQQSSLRPPLPPIPLEPLRYAANWNWKLQMCSLTPHAYTPLEDAKSDSGSSSSGSASDNSSLKSASRDNSKEGKAEQGTDENTSNSSCADTSTSASSCSGGSGNIEGGSKGTGARPPPARPRRRFSGWEFPPPVPPSSQSASDTRQSAAPSAAGRVDTSAVSASMIPFAVEGNLNILRGYTTQFSGKNSDILVRDFNQSCIKDVDTAMTNMVTLLSSKSNAVLSAIGHRSSACTVILKVLETFMDYSSSICESSLVALFWLSHEESNKKKLYGLQVYRLVSHILERYCDIEVVAEWACKLVSVLCLVGSDEATSGKYRVKFTTGEFDVFPCVRQCLAAYSHTSPIVTEWICKAVYCLVQDNPAGKDAVALNHSECCLLLVQAIFRTNHVENGHNILVCGLKAIGNLATGHTALSLMLGDLHVCSRILEVCDGPGHADEGVAEAACWALGNLLAGHSSNQARCGGGGAAAETLIGVLFNHVTAVYVIRESCICLHHLLSAEHTSLQEHALSTPLFLETLLSLHKKAETQMQLHSRGKGASVVHLETIMESVWSVLASLSENSSVCHRLFELEVYTVIVNNLLVSKERSEQTCVWLSCAVNNLCQHEMFAVKFGEVGVSRSLKICTQVYASNTFICYYSCCAVGALCETQLANRTWLGASGMCKILHDILQRHINAQHVVEGVLYALAHLTTAHSNNITKCSEGGLCRAIAGAITQLVRKSPFIGEWGVKCVCNLSTIRENSLQLVAGGACQAICHSMIFQFRVVDVVEWGCKAILNLCGAEENRPGVRRCQQLFCRAIESVFVAHISAPSLVQLVCQTVARLAGDQVVASTLGTEKVGECVNYILQHFADQEKLVQVVCQCIISLANQNATTCLRYGLKGICDSLVSIMQLHAGSESTLRLVVRAMTCLCQHEDGNRLRFGASGVNETLVGVMRGHAASEDMVAEVCECLRWLSEGNEYNCGRLGVAGACDSIVVALQQYYITSTDISISICRTISNMSLHDAENKIRFGASNACEYICKCIEIRLTDEKAVFEGLLAIGSVAKDNALNATKFGALGACSSIVLALKNHSSSAEVAWVSLRAFHGLSSQYDAMELVRGSEYVIHTMLTHARHDKVNEFGCLVIGDLSADHSNRYALVENGACEIVIAVLQIMGSLGLITAIMLNKSSGSSDRTITVAACYALHRLCHVYPEGARRCGQQGACEIAAKVLAKYHEDEGVSRMACRAIASLTDDCDANVQRFGHTGVFRSLAMVLHTHSLQMQTVQWAVTSIENLSTSSIANASKMGDNLICDAIGVAMQTHQGSEEIVSAACGSVSNLALVDGNLIKLSISGTCEATISVLQRYADNIVITKKATKALGHLAVSKSNSGWLGPVGACEVLAQTIRLHSRHEDIALFAWRAVANLCCEAGNISRMGASGVCELLAEALRIYVGAEGVVLECGRCVSAMASLSSNLTKLTACNVCESVMVVLEVHVMSRAVCIEVCRSIHVMSTGHPETQMLLSLENACSVVVQVLRQYGQESHVLALEGCLAVQALAYQNDTNKTQFANLNSVDLLVNLAHAHIKVESACLAVLQAILALVSNNCTNLRALSYSNYCSLLVKTSNFHCTAPTGSVGMSICVIVNMLLYNLVKEPVPPSSSTPANRSDSSNSSSASMPSMAGARTSDEVDVVVTEDKREMADVTVEDVCRSDEGKPEAKDGRDAASKIVESEMAERGIGEAASKLRIISTSVVRDNYQSIKSLRDVAEGGGEGGGGGLARRSVSVIAIEQQVFLARQNRGDLLKMGVCGSLVDLLQRHAASEDVLVSCCNVTYQLLVHDDAEHACTALFSQTALCSVLPRLMQSYTNPSICSLLCREIALLCANTNCQSQFGKSGMCKALVSAIEMHIGNSEVVELCCKAAYALAKNNESNRVKLVSCGAVDIVVIAMQRHAVSNVVPLWASSTIELLGKLTTI